MTATQGNAGLRCSRNKEVLLVCVDTHVVYSLRKAYHSHRRLLHLTRENHMTIQICNKKTASPRWFTHRRVRLKRSLMLTYHWGCTDDIWRLLSNTFYEGPCHVNFYQVILPYLSSPICLHSSVLKKNIHSNLSNYLPIAFICWLHSFQSILNRKPLKPLHNLLSDHQYGSHRGTEESQRVLSSTNVNKRYIHVNHQFFYLRRTLTKGSKGWIRR